MRPYDAFIDPAPEDRASPRAPSWTRGGHLVDMVAPGGAEIDFSTIAETLATLPRWCGRHGGAPVSVAEHCAVGAQALWNETGDPQAALAFLLHDAHEACGIGDVATPVVKALDCLMQDSLGGEAAWAVPAPSILMNRLKALWDVRICAAAPTMHARMFWPDPVAAGVDRILPEAPMPQTVKSIALMVKRMDETMAQAEAHVLFGKRACPFPEHRHLAPGHIARLGRAAAADKWTDAFLTFRSAVI